MIKVRTIDCPVRKQDISSTACEELQRVFEEIVSLSSLPKTVNFTDENQQTCLQCSHHCKQTKTRKLYE